MADQKYESVIGLEVHCQLLTDSKAFSPEPASFGADPNHHIDPVSLGHPGTLPVLNEQVVAYAIRMGLATDCQIAPRSVLARKHYFYPDLPKGYQISQFETPICEHGHLIIQEEDKPARRIGITRIHMEEDAGKSIHDQDPLDSLLDYNRCGTPLIEIVSEPDIRNPREAYLYVQKIRQIVRYLGICDGNMEEGSLRCDVNVSIRPVGQEAFGTKAEIKNLNSLRNVERALEYEIKRQIKEVEAGREIVQETRLWDANKLETRSMRTKELAHDYRYFPDPDLVPIVVTEAELLAVEAELPELPEARKARYVEDLGLPEYDAGVITEERALADFFEQTLDAVSAPNGAAKAVSNWIMTEVMRVLNEGSGLIEDLPIEPTQLAGLVDLRLVDDVSSSGAQEIFEVMLSEGGEAKDIAEARNLLQVSDDGALAPVVEEMLDNHPGQLAQYLGGKEGLIGFFIGQVMRTFPGSPDPKRVRELLIASIEARRGSV